MLSAETTAARGHPSNLLQLTIRVANDAINTWIDIGIVYRINAELASKPV